MKRYNRFRNAAVNLIREDSWCIYADGFERAAELLIENVKSTNDVNTVIFPVLFLYRQYIELSLKEAIGYGRYLDEGPQPPPGGHDLKNLWAEAKSYIRKQVSDVPAAELDRIEKLILDIHTVDPTSEGSRYPVVKKRGASGRDPSFSWNSPHINLDELGDNIQVVGKFLRKVNNYLSVAQDLEAEFRADYYSYGY